MREKQVEEIANILWNIPNNYSLNSYNDCERIAECIYDDGGYRKQSEGEWVRTDWGGKLCSCCNTPVNYMSKFCPNCGAKMNGGEQE